MEHAGLAADISFAAHGGCEVYLYEAGSAAKDSPFGMAEWSSIWAGIRVGCDPQARGLKSAVALALRLADRVP